MLARLSITMLAGLLAALVVVKPVQTMPPEPGHDCTRLLCDDCFLQPYSGHLSCIWVEYDASCWCQLYGPVNGVETCETIGSCCT
jgi:hypothetical protein